MSEETLNLIHSSNPISTVGLRDSSPTTMRSIRVGGRTLARADSFFIVKREREMSILRKEETFEKIDHASQRS